MPGTPETYMKIRDRVHEQFNRKPKDEWEAEWYRTIAPKWRNRVGMPRLIAEAVIFEALTLLRSLNRGLFRNDPESRRDYDEALDALNSLAEHFSRGNWRRFKGQTDVDVGSHDA